MSGRVRRGLAMVAMFAAVALAATACGIPISGSPSVIAKSDVPFHLLDPDTSTTESPSTAPEVGLAEWIYLVSPGPNQQMFGVARDVRFPANLTQILGALLEGPTTVETSEGLQSFLTGTKVTVTASVSGGIAIVDFSSNPFQVVGLYQTLAFAQVVYTATQQPGVVTVGVLFQIAGQPIGVPTTPSGPLVSAPVNRASFATQAAVP
jgi:spore germination protein GerM